MIYVADHGEMDRRDEMFAMAEEAGEREARGTYIAHHGRARVNHLGAGPGRARRGPMGEMGEMGGAPPGRAGEGGRGSKGFGIAVPGWGFYQSNKGKREIKEVAAILCTPCPGHALAHAPSLALVACCL